MKSQTILSLTVLVSNCAFAALVPFTPIPQTLTSASLVVPHLTDTDYLYNDSTFDQTYNLIATGFITPNGTSGTLHFFALVNVQGDKVINGSFEEVGGSSWLQVNGNSTPQVQIVFGQPFTLHLEAFSRVWYYFNSGEGRVSQTSFGYTINGSSVQIVSDYVTLANGGREDGVILSQVGTAAVPEPASVLLVAVGLLGLLRIRR